MVNRVCQTNGKGQLLRLFTLIAVIGVQLIILASLYIPKRDVSAKNFSLRYHQFVYGRGTFITDDKSWKNEANRTSWAYSGKSRDFKDKSTQDPVLLPIVRSSCSQLNFSFASPILEPRFSHEDNGLFLLILIISGVGRSSFLKQRNAIRDTWLMDVPSTHSMKWKHVFLLGLSNDPKIDSKVRREADLHNDILVLNATDNYNNLIIKVLSGFRWAFMQVKPRFILKADDDVYIRLPHLMTWLKESASDSFYGGLAYGSGAPVRRDNGTELQNTVSLDCYAEERFRPYCAGPFYVISSNIVPFLFESMRQWAVFPVEDAFMGLLANASSIQPVKIPGFHLDDNITYHTNCFWASSIALGHHLDSTHLYYLQRKMYETDELQLSRNYSLCALHQIVRSICMILLHLALLVSFIVAVVYAVVMFRPYFPKI